jgi:uncharacterized membrane protein
VDWSPARIFAFIAGICGALLLVLSPPFRWGDENVHFLNALRLSEGRLITASSQGAADAPRGARRLILYFTLKQRLRADRTIPLREAVAASAIPLMAEQRYSMPTPRSPYAPLPYLPQALGIALARLATDSILLLFLAARAANLAAWATLVWLALRIAPSLRWPMCILALAPMSLFLATTCSVDAITNGLAFLWTACVVRVASGPDRVITRRGFTLLAVLAALLALTKFVYGCLILLVFLVPARRFGGAPRLLGAGAALLAVAASAMAAWLAISDPRPSFDAGAPIRRAQRVHARSLVEEPGWVARVVTDTVVKDARRWARQLVDTHWDKRADRHRLLVVWGIALAIALVCDPPFSAGPSLAQRLVALLSAGSTVVAFVLVAYLLWTPILAAKARGVQGRYWIPILPALAIALAPPLSVRDPRLRRAGCALAVALALIPLAATLLEGVDLSIR